MLHYVTPDPHIPSSEIEKVRRAHRDTSIYVYDAGHGFNCDERKDSQSATLARKRTVQFLEKCS